MTLALVVLAGVTLAATARRSTLAAVACESATQRLQRRWAVTTCEATLLPRAAWAMEAAERGRDSLTEGLQPQTYEHPPMQRVNLTVTLADITYRIAITDEQAKVNVNRMLESASRSDAESELSNLLRSSDTSWPLSSRLALRPVVEDSAVTGRGDALAPVGAYGQIFREVTPRELLGDADEDGFASLITCWGNGRVNVRRATDSVIRQVCQRKVSPLIVSALLRVRQRDRYEPLDTMLSEMDRVNFEEKQQLREMLTEQSTCYGLWIVAEGSQRVWHHFTVAVVAPDLSDDGEQEIDQDVSQKDRFTW
ncbi:MAG: hypothetical protein WD294_09320 [Phycisphaeraceae bacterium]